MVPILIVVMIAQVYSYVKTYQIDHLKYVWFIICQLYLTLKENITGNIPIRRFHSLSLGYPEELLVS